MTSSDISAAPNASARPPAKSCLECGKLFVRTEHLQRHQRTHTREAPFSCPKCHRSFQRSDVRNRHLARYCMRKSSNSESRVNGAKYSRVRVACDTCRTKKLKCTGSHPCSPCRKGDRECHYSTEYPRTAKGTDTHILDSSASVTLGEEAALDSNSEPASAVSPNSFQNSPSITNSSNYTLEVPEARSFSLHTMSTDDDDFNPMRDVITARVGSNSTEQLSNSQDCALSHSSTVNISGQFQPPQGPETLNEPPEDFNIAQRSSINAVFEPTAVDLHTPGLGFGLDLSSDNMFNLFFSAEDFTLPFDLHFDEPTTFESHLNQTMFASQDETFDFQQHNNISLQLKGLEAPTAILPHTNSDTTWPMSKPSMDKFDRAIINHFMNIFLREVPRTFTCFIDFEIHKSTSEEEILAIAAVGGLYSVTRGSHLIARAMIGDSRRLLLTRIYAEFPDNTAQKISLVRTFILFELYGICSGDKRLCELSEAFHTQFLQIVSRCNFSTIPETSPSYRIAERIIKDLQILECYRTTLLQWPPSLYLTTLQKKSPPSLPPFNNFDTFDTVKTLLTPSAPPVDLGPPGNDIYSLAALLVLASHAIPTRYSPAQSDYLWDKRSFELGLHSWLRSHQSSPEETTLMLFHTGFITLHLNMDNLHSLVREVSTSKPSNPTALSTIRLWRESAECDIALLHATQLLELGMRIHHRSTFSHAKQPNPNTQVQNEARKGEAPHVAICVYLATITKWAAEITAQPADLDAARTVLNRGYSILQCLHLRIANGFGNVLRTLEVMSK